MKTKISIILILALSSSVFARENPKFKVLLRQTSSNKTYYAEKEMINLESDHSFDGKYFKIVKGKDQEAVQFSEVDEDILLKAANVYYHLSTARDFWINQMKSKVAEDLPKITVRLEIKNQFDDLGHFANDKKSPQYNNALSIPEGQTPAWVPSHKQDKWGKEIWFRPKKIISTKELPSPGPNPINVSLRALRKPLINYTQNQFNVRLMEQIFYPAYVSGPLYQDVIRYAGTFAIMEIMVYGSNFMDRLFIDKYYYLDTAMLPEIVYHEFAHVVLSDTLMMSHSTPVNEGMADYFAAVQSDRRRIYAKVPGRSNSASKDTQEKKKYTHWDESNRNATADFTLSVLWDVRETLGDEFGDKVVYEARKYLKTETSTISHGLLGAIIKACEQTCEKPGRDKLKLYETFTWKGF